MDQRKARLAQERFATAARLTALSSELGGMVAASEMSNADDEHDPEGATIAFERAQVIALLEQACAQVADLDRALEQLDDGTYGICEKCGERIPVERLAVRPSARTCVQCATPRCFQKR